NKGQYGARSVQNWLRRMDAYLRAELPGLRKFERLDKLRADVVARAWKRDAVPCSHPALEAVATFVDALQRVCARVVRRRRRRKCDLVSAVRPELARRARRLRVQSFDDLLLALRGALDAPHGAQLAERLRRRWTAALVDEFQDTDTAQYRIVQRIWGGSGQPVFVVGDPKQAIYRFRGADVFAYLAARRDAA